MNTTRATLHYVSQSGKSACISTKANKFATARTVGFVASQPEFLDENGEAKEGYEFDLPTGWTLEPMVTEDGEPIVTKDGEQKNRFQWNLTN